MESLTNDLRKRAPEALDSVTGEREMALVERKFGKRFALEDGATTWGNVEKAFREWAVQFRLTMDRAHRDAPGS